MATKPGLYANIHAKQERIKHDRTIIQCICGGSYQNYQKKRHEENKKHMAFITNNQ